MRVLVTGGAGYIGAHVVRLLVDRGDVVVVADDLVTGVVGRIGEVPLVQLDLASDAALDILIDAMREHGIDTVVHFAARKQVGESVARPAWYYQQNIGGLANVLLAMERSNVSRLVFSSSAAVYAATSDGPLAESDPTAPVNPYGETKLSGEWLVRDATIAWGLRAISLRYFNVAGAGSPELGDTEAFNLVPMVLEKIDSGERPIIFGDDYPTPDGTCIRDYVHVQDVAEAHRAAIDGLDSLSGHHLFNIGTGAGQSVRQIVDALIAVAEVDVEPVIAARRLGDAAMVVASVDAIRESLGWSARFGLGDIIHSAWEAHEYFREVRR